MRKFEELGDSGEQSLVPVRRTESEMGGECGAGAILDCGSGCESQSQVERCGEAGALIAVCIVR